MFSNHDGYIFHDSRGFEAGGDNELKIVQEFIRERSVKRQLRDRIHAIWFALSTVLIETADSHLLQVLRPNGQPATRARSEAFQRHLSGSKWYVVAVASIPEFI